MKIRRELERRTISIPADVAARVERVARKEKASFSATICRLVDEALRRRTRPRFRSLGTARGGPDDLALNAEDYLRDLFKDFKG